jgi:adsorption protein B
VLYGWEHGLMSLPRMVVGNFVNCMAVARAWRLYLSYLFRGKKLVWDKTMHEFPTGAQLARKRQRLGELLQSWQAVDEGKLAQALEQQASTQTPLGRVLVSNGWLDEETLAEAIAYQADLPRVNLTADLVRGHAGMLPVDLAIRHRAIPLGLNKAGGPVVAVASPLAPEAVAELTAALQAEPLQRIAREGEIAVALRMLREGSGGGSPQAVPTGPLLGDMLIERGLLRKDVFDTAMRDYRPDKHGRIGDYLVDRRVIPRDVVEQVVQDQRKFFAGAQAT